MVYAGPAAADAPGTRTGGLPLVPAGFEWPVCRTCKGPMQFLAQISLADLAEEPGYLAIFMCQNDPGSCDEWDPEAGGNHAAVLPIDGLTVATPPPTGVTQLPEVSATSHTDVESGYKDARKSYGDAVRDVLGQLGGEPDWIQGDEWPVCPECEVLMDFVVQLEEGHDHRTSANYGGGSAYAFACYSDALGAFLWQQ